MNNEQTHMPNVTQLVALEDIRDAALRIRGVARRTPLIEASWPGAVPGDLSRRLWLKGEHLQPVGAFKIRGAYNMLAQLSDADRRRGVITYSSGNHGQAVALSARLLGVPAVIVMPTTAPAIKVDGARALGAEVLFEGTTTIDRKRRAEAEATARGLTIVPPFDHPWIIAGQGTLGLEIVEQCPDAGTVYVQVGGGGLISGVATAIKRSRPEVRVIGVEPAGAPKMSRSLAAGEPIVLETVASIADGLLAVRPGDLNFAHVRAFVDEVVTVDDRQIGAAMAWLFRTARQVVEPSGAVAVAAIMAGAGTPSAGGETVAVLSGGNIEPATLLKYVG